MGNRHHDTEYLFFFNDTATTEIYPLSLHDALPTRADRDDPGPETEHEQDARRLKSPLDRGLRAQQERVVGAVVPAMRIKAGITEQRPRHTHDPSCRVHATYSQPGQCGMRAAAGECKEKIEH